MSEVEAQQSAGADVLSVRRVEGVAEPVIPGPEVVDVRGPEGVVVGEVGRVRGEEDLTSTLPPAQSPPAFGSNSDIDRPVLVVLRVAVLVHCVRGGAVGVGCGVRSDDWRQCIPTQTFLFIYEGEHAGLVGINRLLRSEAGEPGGLPGGEINEVEGLIPCPDISLNSGFNLIKSGVTLEHLHLQDLFECVVGADCH